MVLSWTWKSKKEVVLHGGEAELVAVGSWEGPEGGNPDRSEQGNLVCLGAEGASLYFMSEEICLVGVSGG